MTLDGYIADLNDGLSFLDEYESVQSIKDRFEELMNQVDTLIMGRSTYEIMRGFSNDWPYTNHQTYVLTNKKLEDTDCIHFISSSIPDLIFDLKKTPGKDIWLVGGGITIKPFIEMNLIDLYQITIIPKLLGTGKRLFHEHTKPIDLVLDHTEYLGELLLQTYQRKTAKI